MSPQSLEGLREKEYQQGLDARRLQRLLYEQTDPAASQELLDCLLAAEATLSAIQAERAQAQAADPRASGVILDNTAPCTPFLGPETTGLQVKVRLRLAQVPTSIYHLLDQQQHSLLSCRVYNARKLPGSASDIRRLRVISEIDGYSAPAVNTAEIKLNSAEEFRQLPVLFRERVQNLSELTRATLNVLVEDLDTRRVELHQTYPLWLLAWTTAPLAIQDPKTGEWQDMTRYYGAFVTPNAPSVQEFLGTAKEYHGDEAFRGYQDGASVDLQVEALFNALQQGADLSYVNSIIAFSPEEGTETQRVRLPRESLKHGVANCIDGTVLFASLLEAISMNPAIVVVPRHALLAWETGKNSNQWRYLETTKIHSHSFEQACRFGKIQAQGYKALAEQNGDESLFRQWSLRELRSVHGIFPME